MKLFQGNKPTLASMIEGCKQNERRAQEQLYRHCFDLALRTVKRYTRDEETQLHIVNEGFLRVFKHIDRYKGTGAFEGWVTKIMFHEVSNYYRKKSNNIRFIEIDQSSEGSQENEGLTKLSYDDLLKHIDTLPNMTRQVFVKFAIEGFGHKEIADDLGIKEGTSKWHVSNARQLLIRRLDEEEPSKQAR